MDIITWLIVGGLIGWVATRVMRADAQQGIALNIVVGIVGALSRWWALESPARGCRDHQSERLQCTECVRISARSCHSAGGCELHTATDGSLVARRLAGRPKHASA